MRIVWVFFCKPFPTKINTPYRKSAENGSSTSTNVSVDFLWTTTVKRLAFLSPCCLPCQSKRQTHVWYILQCMCQFLKLQRIILSLIVPRARFSHPFLISQNFKKAKGSLMYAHLIITLWFTYLSIFVVFIYYSWKDFTLIHKLWKAIHVPFSPPPPPPTTLYTQKKNLKLSEINHQWQLLTVLGNMQLRHHQNLHELR